MKSVKIREKQQERYKNLNVEGCTVLITSVNAGSVTGYPVAPKWENILVKGILNRGGKDQILFNETLKNLLYLSEWDTPNFEFVNGMVQPVRMDAANKTFLYPLKFNFGGIINLDGSDELTLEFTVGAGTYDVNVDENASFLQFDVIEGVGLEVHTPYIKSRVIEANQSNPQFDLGDSVMEILIANYDKTNMYNSTAVLNNISIDSDKWSRNDSYEEMISRNFGQFNDFIQGFSRYQSFRIYSGYELDAVKINLSLNTANVAASQNVVLWYSFETNNQIVTKAAHKAKKFRDINNLKGQFVKAA